MDPISVVSGVDDADLGRRVVEWLGRDAEGRRILQALVEHPEVGRAALSRRLQRPGFLEPVPPPDRPTNGAAAHLNGHAAQLSLRRTEATPAVPAGAGRLPRLLRWAGTLLLGGGFAAFMLGVVTLGGADPGFPPLSIFGLALMVTSAAPLIAGGSLSDGRWPELLRLPPLTVTATVVAAAVAIAGTAAHLVSR